MAELKPCPFCGGKAQIRYTGNGSGYLGYTSNIVMKSKPGFVMCLKCNVATTRNSRLSKAIEKWNRRAPEIVKVETSFYDKEEIHENCTVQVLTNTKTGEVSVGWWENNGR